MISIRVEWQRREYVIPIADSASLGALGTAIAAATDTSFETLKLLQGGRIIVPVAAPQQTVAEAGMDCGMLCTRCRRTPVPRQKLAGLTSGCRTVWQMQGLK